MKRIIGALWILLLTAIPAYAVLSTETTKVAYTCNGTSTSYAYTFKILSGSDLLVVKKNTSTLAESTLALTTDYTVTGAGGSGGNVVLTAGNKCSTGNTLTIMRNVPATQLTDYVDGEAFSAESIENALDKNTMILQQQKEQLIRTPKLPRTSTITDIAMPNPSSNGYIGWNSAASNLENKAGPVVTTATQYEVDALTSYGGGTSCSRTTIAAALVAIGTTNPTSLLLRPCKWDVGTDLAFPSNITVIMPPGSFFSGAGKITGLKIVRPEMFDTTTSSGVPGKVNDTGVNNAPAIVAALRAVNPGGSVLMSPGEYYVQTEMAPDFGMQGIQWKADGQSRIQWNGSTDHTKAVFRVSVNASIYFTSNNVQGISFYAAGKAGFAFVLGIDVTGGNAADNVFSKCQFEQGTIAALVIGNNTEPTLTDSASSLNVFNQCMFVNSPYGVKINAPNAYENTFNQPYFISNIPNIVIQQMRILYGGMTRIHSPEFGIMGNYSTGFPHGAAIADNNTPAGNDPQWGGAPAGSVYAVYTESPTVIRDVYSEDSRILKVSDSSHSWNAMYVVDNVYINDSRSTTDLNHSFFINCTNANITVRNATPRSGGGVLGDRKIVLYSGGRLYTENVDMGPSGFIATPILTNTPETARENVIEGVKVGSAKSLIPNWNMNRWRTLTTGDAHVPYDWSAKVLGGATVKFNKETGATKTFTGGASYKIQTTIGTPGAINGIRGYIPVRELDAGTIIVAGFLSDPTKDPDIVVTPPSGTASDMQIGSSVTYHPVAALGSGYYDFVTVLRISGTGLLDGLASVDIGLAGPTTETIYIDSVVVYPFFVKHGDGPALIHALQEPRFPSIIYGPAVPTDAGGSTNGPWQVGDTIWNSAPSVGQPIGWKCTVAGSPGTWVAMANL